MKKIFTFGVGACLSVGAMAQSTLAFDANAGVKSKMTAYDGTCVNYTAYEWLYQHTDSRQALDETHKRYTKELAALFPAYLNSLSLKKPDGTPLTADNYLDYLKSEIIRSAQIAKNAGADIPDSLGFKFTSEAGGMFAAPINGRSSESHSSLLGYGRVASDVGRANGGMRPQMQDDKHPMMQGGQPPMGMRPMRGGRKQVGEYITDLDM